MRALARGAPQVQLVLLKHDRLFLENRREQSGDRLGAEHRQMIVIGIEQMIVARDRAADVVAETFVRPNRAKRIPVGQAIHQIEHEGLALAELRPGRGDVQPACEAEGAQLGISRHVVADLGHRADQPDALPRGQQRGDRMLKARRQRGAVPDLGVRHAGQAQRNGRTAFALVG